MPKSRIVIGRAEISLPPWTMAPAVWISRPAMARKSVVLPQPEGPRKQTNSPSYTSREMFLSAAKSPKNLLKSRIDKYGARSPLGPFVSDAVMGWS